MAARRFFHTRLFFSCLSEIGSKRKMSFGCQLLNNSVCIRKTLSVTQCPKFKAKVSISVAINPVGDRDRNNLKTTVANSAKSLYRSLSRFVCCTGLVAFYTYYSSFAACAENSDDEKENNEECRRRHKGCFAAKRRVSQLESLAKARSARTVKNDQPEENDDDMGPPRKIATRSKQVCSWRAEHLYGKIHCCKLACFAISPLSLPLVLKRSINDNWAAQSFFNITASWNWSGYLWFKDSWARSSQKWSEIMFKMSGRWVSYGALRTCLLLRNGLKGEMGGYLPTFKSTKTQTHWNKKNKEDTRQNEFIMEFFV